MHVIQMSMDIIEQINEMYEVEDIESKIEKFGRIDPKKVPPVRLSEDDIKRIKREVNRYVAMRYGKYL